MILIYYVLLSDYLVNCATDKSLSGRVPLVVVCSVSKMAVRVKMDIGASSTSILVFIVARALIGSITTMNLQRVFGINRSTQTTYQDSSACQPDSTCNNTASERINFIGRSDNNVASEDIFGLNVCYFNGNPTCSNEALQFLVINGDGNRATLRTD